MNLYLENGYLDMAQIIESGYPFIFVPAARGTGKTYGALKYHLEHGNKILLIRRTQEEADLQANAETTSYKKIFTDLGIDEYKCISGNKTAGAVLANINESMRILAYTGALSTFTKIRGVDFTDIDYIVFDEFIAEPHVKKIKAEGMALAQIYETVNRNRELEGRDPVQLLCLANSVNMANDCFMYFDLIRPAEEMLQNDEEVRILGNKLLIIPQHSPISELKSKTALYQAVNNEFSEMAIKNKFILNDFTYVRKRDLTEYRCLFKVGDLYCWKHKSMHEFYFTFSRGETKQIYSAGYADLTRFRRDRWRYAAYYLDGMIRFENYNCIALFEKYMDMD